MRNITTKIKKLHYSRKNRINKITSEIIRFFQIDFFSNSIVFRRKCSCIYCKIFVPLKVIKFLVKVHCFISFTKSISRWLWQFLKNFELNLDTILANNPFWLFFLVTLMLSQNFGVKVAKHHMKAQKLRV